MKMIKLTTYRQIDQIIDLLELLDDLRDALIDTYQQEIDQYCQERWEEKMINQARTSNLSDDSIDF